MKEIKEKYLPIGTVVMLKEGTKRTMIVGFCTIAEDDQEKMYDYCGCLYPEGSLSSSQVLLFDHDQIEEVYQMGYSDEENEKFQTSLKNIVSQLNEKKSKES